MRADGGLTFYVQHDTPGADKESNWLLAPGALQYARGSAATTLRLPV